MIVLKTNLNVQSQRVCIFLAYTQQSRYNTSTIQLKNRYFFLAKHYSKTDRPEVLYSQLRLQIEWLSYLLQLRYFCTILSVYLSMKTEQAKSFLVPANKIYQSYTKNKPIVVHTRLEKSAYLSKKYNANVYLKREDLQAIRSFKIRGAATAFRYLTEQQRKRGVVTASAGNHAQGIAYCCNQLKIKGTIFMPATTPKIKFNYVKHHGGQWLDIVLVGTTFDDAVSAAMKFRDEYNSVFIHAFDNIKVIEGQGGVAAELLEEWNSRVSIDYVFTCVGGGGLASGIGSYLAQMAPDVKLVGFEPLGSPSMYNSLKVGRPIVLDSLDTFVDGASMKKTGKIPFEILNELNLEIHLVPEGLVAKTMLEMYNEQAVILEPAGTLGVAGLQLKKDEIVGKNVVCILSGSNNDISRLPEVRIRSRIYECKEAYYILSYPSSLNIRIMVQKLVNPEEQDVIFINSAKKFNSSAGQCLIGFSFENAEAKTKFQDRAIKSNFKINQLAANDPLLKILL